MRNYDNEWGVWVEDNSLSNEWWEYTNYPWLWQDLKLDKNNCSLWVMFHKVIEYRDIVMNKHDIIIENSNISLTIGDIKRTKGWSTSNKIFLLHQEAEIVDWTKYKDNIYVWDSSVSRDDPRFYSSYWWWWQVREIELYTKNTELLLESNNKPFIFDCLLGLPRIHRDYIYYYVLQNNLQDDIMISYNEYHIQGSVLHNENNETFNDMVPYHTDSGKVAKYCCFLPVKIYNESFFSIIAETHIDRIFFTEKTAKPILAERLFIFFGKEFSLYELHEMGYITFSDIIDESYDEEPNNYLRWEMAMEQVKKLCNMDIEYVCNAIKPIVRHNKQLFMDTNYACQQRLDIQKLCGSDK